MSIFLFNGLHTLLEEFVKLFGDRVRPATDNVSDQYRTFLWSKIYKFLAINFFKENCNKKYITLVFAICLSRCLCLFGLGNLFKVGRFSYHISPSTVSWTVKVSRLMLFRIDSHSQSSTILIWYHISPCTVSRTIELSRLSKLLRIGADHCKQGLLSPLLCHPGLIQFGYYSKYWPPSSSPCWPWLWRVCDHVDQELDQGN